MNSSTPATEQLSLFDAVVATYEERERASNEALYQEVAARAGIPDAALACRERIGKHRYNPTKRKIRWVQQTLKHMGLVERAGPGVWTLSAEGYRKLKLKRINAGHVMLAFSTDFGVALWANCASAFSRLGEPIHLALTSPPYPLSKPRAYGNPSEGEFVDFICRALEPIVRRLIPGGSLVLNVTNDVFERGLPSRSLYRERMVIALHERLGLHKMDEIPWENLSKPPGPVQWASKARNQLNTGWEPVYWFTNDPQRVRADNRRVLLPHTERHLKFLQSGGVKRDREYADGAYRQRAGKSYSNITEGRIPRNVLRLGHICALQNAYKRDARASGLTVHGAPFPGKLVEFFIKFLSTEGDLIADPFGGSLTVPLMAEMLGRRWIATEVIWDYLAGGALRFDSRPTLAPGFAACAAA
ncbi:MAG: DNA methyltransferase [Steroidobacteraceae bacterium]